MSISMFAHLCHSLSVTYVFQKSLKDPNLIVFACEPHLELNHLRVIPRSLPTSTFSWKVEELAHWLLPRQRA